jgi:hypothetical protein
VPETSRPPAGLKQPPPRPETAGIHAGLKQQPPRLEPAGIHAGLKQPPPRPEPAGLHAGLKQPTPCPEPAGLLPAIHVIFGPEVFASQKPQGMVTADILSAIRAGLKQWQGFAGLPPRLGDTRVPPPALPLIPSADRRFPRPPLASEKRGCREGNRAPRGPVSLPTGAAHIHASRARRRIRVRIPEFVDKRPRRVYHTVMEAAYENPVRN